MLVSQPGHVCHQHIRLFAHPVSLWLVRPPPLASPPQGYVRVKVEPRLEEEQVVVRVEDSGIGIPAEKLGSIWGAFEQVWWKAGGGGKGEGGAGGLGPLSWC